MQNLTWSQIQAILVEKRHKPKTQCKFGVEAASPALCAPYLRLEPNVHVEYTFTRLIYGNLYLIASSPTFTMYICPGIQENGMMADSE